MDLPNLPGPEAVEQPQMQEGQNRDINAAQETPTQGPTALDKLSERIAQLSDLDAKTREERQKLQEQMTEYEKYKQWKELEELKNTNKLAWLEKQGVSMESLTEEVIQDEDYQKGAEYRALKKDIESFKDMMSQIKKENNELKNQIQEKEQMAKEKEANSQTQAYLTEIDRFISQDAEKYEMIKHYGDANTILQMQTEYYKKHNTMCDMDKLCDAYEKHLESGLDEQYNKFKNLKKFSSKYGNVNNENSGFESTFNPFAPDKGTYQIKGPETRTITNEFNNSSPPADNNRVLSDQESIEKAAQLLRFVDDY